MQSILKISLISGICFLIACTEEITSNLDTQTAVVEGYLFAGHPTDSIFIRQSFSYARENADLITLDDLEVVITDNTEAFLLTHQENGYYQNLNFIPQSGKTYTLSFDYNGETISAETYIPEKRAISISEASIALEKITGFGGFGGGSPFGEEEAIEITWDNSDGDYYYVVIENIEENPEFVNDLLAQFGGNGFSIRFFRITEPEISDFHALNTRRDLTQYGTYRIIVYRVNPEYAALYESAGTSSVTIAEPPSNIENGLGIFTGVSSDTVYLEVVKK